MVRQSKVGVELVLEQWFDVVARLTVLLHQFIQSEIESRKNNYVENFCWLARKNVEYIRDKRSYLHPIVTLIREPKKTNLLISLDDLEKAVKVLAPNPTIP
jgi:hypothetical protein